MKLLLMLVIGCEESKVGDGIPIAVGEVVSSFSLKDVNPSSSTYKDSVSPNTFSTATAWYFGHST